MFPAWAIKIVGHFNSKWCWISRLRLKLKFHSVRPMQFFAVFWREIQLKLKHFNMKIFYYPVVVIKSKLWRANEQIKFLNIAKLWIIFQLGDLVHICIGRSIRPVEQLHNSDSLPKWTNKFFIGRAFQSEVNQVENWLMEFQNKTNFLNANLQVFSFFCDQCHWKTFSGLICSFGKSFIIFRMRLRNWTSAFVCKILLFHFKQ